jgi:hypothetical protein
VYQPSNVLTNVLTCIHALSEVTPEASGRDSASVGVVTNHAAHVVDCALLRRL